MNDTSISVDETENTGEIVSPAETEKENPYRYYSVSKKNLIVLVIYFLVSLVIFCSGFLLVEFATKGYDSSHNMVIVSVVVLVLLLFLFICIQNHRHAVWEKDREIKDLKNSLDAKNMSIRDLSGEVSELESHIQLIERQLMECTEEKKERLQEISRLRKERKDLSAEIEDLKDQLSEVSEERERLRTSREQLDKELQKSRSVQRAYEKRARPFIEAKSFMSVKRGEILGILKVDDVYNVSFQNKGPSPAFDIKGEVRFHPVRGKPIPIPISIIKLNPGEKRNIALGGKKKLRECSKLGIDIAYKDILGNTHSLKGEMPY